MITDATDQLIRLALAEDVGTGDRTTLATIAAGTQCAARVVAKEPLVLAGCAYAIRVFQHVDPTVRVTQLAQDGDAIATGVDVLTIEGDARSVLSVGLRDDQAEEGRRGVGIGQGGPQEAVPGQDTVRTPEVMARISAHPVPVKRSTVVLSVY